MLRGFHSLVKKYKFPDKGRATHNTYNFLMELILFFLHSCEVYNEEQ